MAEKKQRNIRMEDQLVDRLTRLAPKAGFDSWNEFAAEALDIYAETLVDLIVELRKIEQTAVMHQRERLLAKMRQVLQESGIDRDEDRERSRRK